MLDAASSRGRWVVARRRDAALRRRRALGPLCDRLVHAAASYGAGIDDGAAFSSNGDGTLSVVRETSPGVFATAQTVPTNQGALTMTIDPVAHLAYLVTAEFDPAPAPTKEQPRPRPAMIPDTFVGLVVGP